MKQMNKDELHCVSGAGIVSCRGRSVYVDTTGIPSHCVGELEATGNTISRVAKRPDVNMAMMMNAVAPHVDIMIASGCDIYISDYKGRLEALNCI